MKGRTTYNSIYRQGSGESSYSQRSSDLSLDEEREHFRRDTERQALLQLEKGKYRNMIEEIFEFLKSYAFNISKKD